MPMASLNLPYNTDAYWVVHPLDDLLEEKRDPSGLGPMPMTLSVRLSLFALRAYLELPRFGGQCWAWVVQWI